jgi:hypothetical protein
MVVGDDIAVSGDDEAAAGGGGLHPLTEDVGGHGGTGIVVKGGDSYHTSGYGVGGVGLYVEGGSGTVGGAGIVVKVGTGNGGNAIEAHGNVIIKDKSGEYLTIISSGAEGTDINGVKIIDNKVKAQNGFFQTSDETLKDFHNDIQVDFEKLSLIPKKQFTWKSDKEKHMEIGTSAQEVQKLYPELVSENENGILSVSYDKLSIVALKAIDKLYKKNQELEERIEKLESLLK